MQCPSNVGKRKEREKEREFFKYHSTDHNDKVHYRSYTSCNC